MKQRIWEAIKSVLIVVLLCSLLLLVAASLPSESIRNTPWLSTVLQPFGRILSLPQAELSYVETELPVMDAAQPLAISVRNHAGRTSFLWDFDSLDTGFETLGSLLAEAMDTAGEFRPASNQQIYDALSETSVYFSYESTVPVSMLAAWLDVNLQSAPEHASAAILAIGEEQVQLFLLDTNAAYTAQTQIDSDTLIMLLEAYRPDGSAFAFEQQPTLDPLTLLPPDNFSIYEATSENPCTGRFLEQLATTLGFNPYGDASYTNGQGDIFYSENNCSLTIRADGMLQLEAEQVPRFRAAGTGDTELVEEARRLLDLVTGTTLGSARLYLTDLTRTENETVCTFSYFLSGLPVETDRVSAVVRFNGSYLSQMQVHLITYRLTTVAINLLPPNHAAAILPAGSRLAPAYGDNGTGLLTAGWKKPDY